MGGDAPRGPSRDAAGGGFRGRSEGGFTRSAGPGARTGAPGFGAPPRVGQDRGGATERPRFGENAVRPERPRYGDAAPRAERPRFGEGAARSDRPRYGDAAARADRPRFGDARREPRNDARAEPRKAPDPSRSGSAAPADQGNPKPNAQPSTRAKKPKTERPKFDVTCMQCGTAAQVPFRPIEGRDVFCQPCYQARRGPAPAGPGAPSTEPSPDAAPTAEVAARGDTSHAHERAPDGPVGLEASAPDDGDAVEHADPTSTPASGSSPAS